MGDNSIKFTKLYVLRAFMNAVNNIYDATDTSSRAQSLCMCLYVIFCLEENRGQYDDEQSADCTHENKHFDESMSR